MTCPMESSMDTLLDYCAGQVEGAGRAGLERHIAACAACKRFVAEQSAVWQSLERYEAPPVSPDFDSKLWARIEAEQSRRRWWTPVWRPALAGLMAVVALFVAIVLHRAGPMAPAPQRPAAVQTETADADRLERALDDADMLRQMNSVDGAQVM